MIDTIKATRRMALQKTSANKRFSEFLPFTVVDLQRKWTCSKESMVKFLSLRHAKSLNSYFIEAF